MSALDHEYVPVPLGFCPCLGTPHEDGDVVFLYPDLPAPAGVRARAFFTAGMTGELDSTTVEERIAELWLSMCVADWTFLLDNGKPIPVTPENVLRALPYGKGGRLVADKADDLYVESVTAPLAERLAPGPLAAWVDLEWPTGDLSSPEWDPEAAEAVVDRHYGQGASARMTYRAWMAARQLLTEERFGVLIRQAPKAEDAAFRNAADQAPRG